MVVFLVVGRINMGSISDLWVRLVICGYGLVLWCAVGLFCGSILVVVVLRFFIYLFILFVIGDFV